MFERLFAYFMILVLSLFALAGFTFLFAYLFKVAFKAF